MSLECYTQKFPIARKEHKCEFCRKKIAVGEKYSHMFGKFDGEFFDRKTCMPCDRMIGEYCAEVDDEFNYEEITDYLREKYCWECEWLEDCEDTPESCQIIREKYS